MKSLDTFVTLFENKEKNNDIISEKRWIKRPSLKELQGKDPDDVSDDANWAIDEPTDDDIMEEIDWANSSENVQILKEKMNAEEDFFIQGRAGWGKTSLIKKIAKKHGYHIITVYLDKCEAEDLEGNPVSMQNKRGNAVTRKAMPEWASIMRENPEKDFLLFFDEMNQAQPDVMNALMPIVLEHEISGHKFDNFFVGAAGNFEDENGAVNELSGPLKSRFKPLIIWETNTDETWNEAFDFLHKKWDSEFGADFINLFSDNRELFDNPREIDHKIFGFLSNSKKGGDVSWMPAKRYLKRLQGLAKEDLTMSEQKKLATLAEAIYEKMNEKEGNSKQGGEKKAKKGKDMISEDLRKAIKNAMVRGYMIQNEDENGNPVEKGGKPVKYGISRECIFDVFANADVNAEMLQRLINKFEADGLSFKYEKDSEFKKAGLKHPADD